MIVILCLFEDFFGKNVSRIEFFFVISQTFHHY